MIFCFSLFCIIANWMLVGQKQDIWGRHLGLSCHLNDLFPNIDTISVLDEHLVCLQVNKHIKCRSQIQSGSRHCTWIAEKETADAEGNKDGRQRRDRHRCPHHWSLKNSLEISGPHALRENRKQQEKVRLTSVCSRYRPTTVHVLLAVVTKRLKTVTGCDSYRSCHNFLFLASK